ncbi:MULTISPECIES: hypothetical protein [unclassified Carboxylicivirga]|uniref:hypothetical protein n=1 Tax=Carboxylicivirga TaxID=1628153 RepID=UPI003D3428E3
MKRYIEQLIEDLESAQAKASERLYSFFDAAAGNEEQPLQDDDEEGIKLCDLIGIEQFYFPDIDYADDEEIEMLVERMQSLYTAYGLNPLFEQCVNARIKYGHLRYYLAQPVYPLQYQMVDIEMCDYLSHHCPLFDLCSQHNTHGVCCAIKKRA